MQPTCTTTNTDSFGKFIELQVHLNDMWGSRINNAQVWAVYPSGRQVSFIQNINGWYEPQQKDNPNPNDPSSYGNYRFYVSYNGQQQSRERQINNYYLPIPTNLQIIPWPLKRGQSFTVSWTPVIGANYYKVDFDEKSTLKIAYITPVSSSPSILVDASVWNYLKSGTQYYMLTQSMNTGDYDVASATSFINFDLGAVP